MCCLEALLALLEVCTEIEMWSIKTNQLSTPRISSQSSMQSTKAAQEHTERVK